MAARAQAYRVPAAWVVVERLVRRHLVSCTCSIGCVALLRKAKTAVCICMGESVSEEGSGLVHGFDSNGVGYASEILMGI